MIEWKRFIKLLDVILDEWIILKAHIRTAENKIENTIGLLYRAKLLPNTSSTSTNMCKNNL